MLLWGERHKRRLIRVLVSVGWVSAVAWEGLAWTGDLPCPLREWAG